MYKYHYQTHLVGMSPVSTTAHACSTSSVHVPSVHWATSAHGSSSGSHVTPHWSTPGGSAQAGNGAAAPTKVSTVGESSSEGWGRQEAARWTVEAATRTRSCRHIKTAQKYSLLNKKITTFTDRMVINYIPKYQPYLL